MYKIVALKCTVLWSVFPGEGTCSILIRLPTARPRSVEFIPESVRYKLEFGPISFNLFSRLFSLNSFKSEAHNGNVSSAIFIAPQLVATVQGL